MLYALRLGYMYNSLENQIKETFPWVLSLVLFLKQTQEEATGYHPWHPWTSRKVLGFLFFSLSEFFFLIVQQVR